MSLLQEICPQLSPNIGAPQVTIKLAECWHDPTIERFQRFVKQIFKEKSTALANIRVETGCICVTWIARKSAIPSLVAQAQEKTELMQLVGVLRMSISEIDILEQQEDTFLFSSALDQATRADCVDAVVILLSLLEADPNSSDSEGRTPLGLACHYGNIRIATLLLQARANINQQTKTGWTALMVACDSETPHNDLVRLLVQSGADISIKTSELQRTALMYAAKRGHTSIVQYLLDEGAPVDTQDVNGVTSLMSASQFGNSSDSEGRTPLGFACHYGNIRIATLLLQARANINQQTKTGWTALMVACDSETPHNDLVRLLVQSGADISIKTSELQRTALMYAAIRGHTSIVQYLLDEGAPVDTQDVNGVTSLMSASQFGHSEVVCVLINCGADVNILAKDPNTTALISACSYQRTICVDLLLAGGADPNLCSREHSPLGAACIIADQQMDPTILNKLLSAGANPNIQTAGDGNTALMEAASYGYEKGVQVLLNAAADINIQISFGTALHYAAERGHLAVSKMLLASGARASLTDSNGDTPLNVALSYGHHKVCELLRTSMDSDLPRTTQETVNTQPSHTAQEIDKPVQDSPRPQKAHRSNILPTIKQRRSILPSIASVGRLFKSLLLPDRAIKLRSNQTQEPNTANN